MELWSSNRRRRIPSGKREAGFAQLYVLGILAALAELRKSDAISSKALQFTILTASRTGETTGAVWEEFDLKAKLWIVPPARMKANREHRVPLGDHVVAILNSLPRDNRFVFPGARGKTGLSNMAMLMLLRGIRDDGSTVHGFRSAFSTWAREQTNYPREIVEACLAHASGDAVELAYLRTDFIDKRRALMTEWAEFFRRPVGSLPSAV